MFWRDLSPRAAGRETGRQVAPLRARMARRGASREGPPRSSSRESPWRRGRRAATLPARLPRLEHMRPRPGPRRAPARLVDAVWARRVADELDRAGLPAAGPLAEPGPPPRGRGGAD